VNSHARSTRWLGYRHCLAAVLLLACKQDCVYYPCPEFEAVRVTVTAAGSSGPPPELAIAVGDGPSQTGMCDAQGVCHVLGPPGEYRLTITAAGFNPRQLDVTVTGEAAGCNTCGHVDRQQLTVVLQPAL